MNIFALDLNPEKAAIYHCDKHVVKMVLETAQILSTVTGHGYKPTHKNHPCTVWTAQSTGNFEYVYLLGIELGKEYKRRYGKRHKSSFIIAEQWPPPSNIKAGALQPFAQAMPEQYRQDDGVLAYRAYYIGEKLRFATYKNREWPEWLEAGNV